MWKRSISIRFTIDARGVAQIIFKQRVGIMKRTVHKFTALLFISTITFLWSTRESTTNLEKIDLSPEVESDERYFNKSHSVWPKLAGLKISSIVDESRPNFRPWLDFDGSCSKFRTHFAKNDTFQPPVYLTSYPGFNLKKIPPNQRTDKNILAFFVHR